jgi:hypothetical protein
MSSEEDDDVTMYWYLRRRNIAKRIKWWMHPYIKNNRNKNVFVDAKELLKGDRKFHSFYRMSKESFSEVAERIRLYIQKQDTNFRRSISVEKGLLIMLK